MPELEWNSVYFGGQYDWVQGGGGEEWSRVWGGSEPQWFGSLYPRLHRILPTGTVVEIAQGYGRWTKYLLPLCRHYIGIDVSQQCVEACRQIFAGAHATFEKTDGLTLPNVQDRSVDFVFSFDSLVHVELDVVKAYVGESLRVLTPNGVAFIHHSNLLPFAGSVGQPHARATSVSAGNVRDSIASAGGHILLQEIINWGGDHMHDCLTLFARGRLPAPCDPVQLENPRFMEEATIINDFQAPWSKIGLR
jgi:SAM-dependent methyltransferase